LFTSPQETPRNARKRKEKELKECLNQRLLDSSGDEIFDLSSRRCESSDLDLPDVAAISVQGGVNTSTRGIFKGKSAAIMALEKYEAEKLKERKHNQKEKNAKNKSATKEAEKEQKRLAKEEKAMERERVAELAKVNVLRTDKKKSTLEMIVDMPSCLDTRLAEQIRTFLKPVEAEHSEYECTQPVIKWRRKIDSNFNEEAGHWEKVKSYVGSEKHIMFIMTAEEFVDLATGEEGKDLDSHVLRLKAKFSANDIIYLIQGLQPWMRKNKNRQNRKYLQDVRYQMSGEANAPAASQKRRKRPEQDHVEEDLLEDVLLKLQVMHGVLIHHTSVAIETAEWVVIFTQHISTVRYR
jgi:crossover junction endonuclease EME1